MRVPTEFLDTTAFLNLGYHSKMLPLPKGIVLLHAGLAVTGYLLLLISVFALR